MSADEAFAAIDVLKRFIEDAHRQGDKTTAKGFEFEQRFRALCERRGLCVELPPGRRQYDLVVNGLRCQLKCKSTITNGNGHVVIMPAGATAAAYAPDAFDVLVVELAGTLCIAPASYLPRQYDGRIQSNMRPGWLTKFADAWWVFDKEHRPSGFEFQMRFDLE